MEKDNRIEINIKFFSGRAVHLKIRETATIAMIKWKLFKIEGIHPDSQVLSFNGAVLEGGKSLKEAGIMQDSAIHLIIAVKKSNDVRLNELEKKCLFLEEQVKQLQQQLVVVSKKEKNWQPLLKACGTDLVYDNPLWTNSEVLNPDATDEKDFTKSAKYQAMIDLPVLYLKIVSQKGFTTELKLPERSPLIEFFQRGEPVYLKYVSGSASPLELACGLKGIKTFAPEWRINASYSSYNFKCRLGGYFYHYWDYFHQGGVYGSDKNGKQGSAEMAGFGIDNCTWGGTANRFSFGVKQAYDTNSLPGGFGQLVSGAIIYGR